MSDVNARDGSVAPNDVFGGRRSRIVGCLLGGAVGDAFGAAVEFDSLHDIRARHGPDGVRGFVPAYGRLGAITDDTQMTLFTAEGLLRAGPAAVDGDLERTAAAIADAYKRWLATQDANWPGSLHGSDVSGWLVNEPVLHSRRAPGMTCMSALRSGTLGRPDAPLNDSKGCGAVMRVAPIGLVASKPFALAVAAAALTHGHPSGYLSAGAFASVIGGLAGGVPLATAIQQARSELVAWHGYDETVAAIDAAVDLASSGRVTPERLETLGGGWVGEEALAMSLCCALVAESLLDGVRLAVNHSGDSDSTGAITGNLLGAMYGIDAVAPDLLAELEARDVIEQVGHDLADAFVEDGTVDSERYPYT